MIDGKPCVLIFSKTQRRKNLVITPDESTLNTLQIQPLGSLRTSRVLEKISSQNLPQRSDEGARTGDIRRRFHDN